MRLLRGHSSMVAALDPVDRALAGAQRVGQLLLQRLLAPDRFAELNAFVGVSDGHVEQLAAEAQPDRRAAAA